MRRKSPHNLRLYNWSVWCHIVNDLRWQLIRLFCVYLNVIHCFVDIFVIVVIIFTQTLQLSGSLCCSLCANGSNFFMCFKSHRSYLLTVSKTVRYFFAHSYTLSLALSSPDYTKIITTSILERLFAVQSIEVCYSGFTVGSTKKD